MGKLRPSWRLSVTSSSHVQRRHGRQLVVYTWLRLIQPYSMVHMGHDIWGNRCPAALTLWPAACINQYVCSRCIVAQPVYSTTTWAP